jgi:hypothetical protein
MLKPVAGIELLKEVFTSRARWMPLIVEWNAAANMLYLLKHLLLLIIIIFKLKCNNLIFNEIMVWNTSYVCLHAFSLRPESPDLDPGRRTPYFRGGFVTGSGQWCTAIWRPHGAGREQGRLIVGRPAGNSALFLFFNKRLLFLAPNFLNKIWTCRWFNKEQILSLKYFKFQDGIWIKN